MKKILASILLFCFLIFFTHNAQAQSTPTQNTLEGKIVDIQKQDENVQKIEVLITKGEIKGKTIHIESQVLEQSKKENYKTGDELLIISTKDAAGNEFYYIADKIRRTSLYILFGVFILLALVTGKKQGALSLLGMAASFLVIFTYILPQIIMGQNPVVTAIIGATIIIPITFILSHGMNAKTIISIISTITALVITGILSYIFVNFSSLTGTASEESTFLVSEIGKNINLQGILLAGIIIASLGVLDDVTIAQASLIQELKRANEKLMFKDLFKRGMNVGRDHIASVINTLVLVYTGASLPLLLLFTYSNRSFSEVVNYEIIASEIVKMLVGSIGLILAVPITTVIAAYFFQEAKREK